MLREVENPRQIEGEPRRRWFSAAECDLVAWYGDGGLPIGFQFIYTDRDSLRKVLTWLDGKGLSHESFDDGEGRAFRHKMTPIMLPDGALDSGHIIAILKAEGAEIEGDLLQYVIQRIAGG